MNPDNPVPTSPIQSPNPDILPTGVTAEQPPPTPTPVAQPVTPPEPPKPTNKTTSILIIVLALVGLGTLGYWAYQSYFASPKPITDVSTTTPVATIDPTASWKTYTNTAYKFSFKYPSSLFLKEGDGVNMPLVFMDVKEINIPSAWDFKLTPLDFSVKETSLDKAINTSGFTNSGQSKTLLSPPLEGYTFEGTLGPGPGEGTKHVITIIQIPGSGDVLSIDFVANTELNRTLYDQILSTFKFTDQTTDETANWKTYTNQLYKYTVKYPEGWYIYDKGTYISDTNIKDPKKIVIISTNKIDTLPAGDPQFSNAVVISAYVGAVLKNNIDTETYKVEDVRLAGTTALKVTAIGELIMGNPNTNYYIDYGGQTYAISFENTDFNGNHNPVFDQILSTFEFVN